MKEMLYRQSRIARALGEPPKYAILHFLLKKGPQSLGNIAKAIHRSRTTTCYHLSKLKGLEIVRYETKANGVLYWIKYRSEITNIVSGLERFVKRTLTGVHADT